MPFPTTPLLDDFARANGGLGADWTSPAWSTDEAPTISANVVIDSASTFGSAFWNPATFSESEVWLTIPAGGTSFSQIVLLSRIKNPGPTMTAWWLQCDVAAGIQLSRVVAGGGSAVLMTVAINLVAGNKVGLRTTTEGNDIRNEIWVDVGAGWVLRDAHLDVGRAVTTPSLASAGNIGFRQYGNGATTRSVDDFGGGEIVYLPSPIYTPSPMKAVR